MKLHLKKLAALALSAALLAGTALAATPEEIFPDQYEYPGFIDVDPDAWYADAARVCATAGLMQGTGQGFAPDEILTVGEVAAIAARMNAATTGDPIPMATPKEGETLPWYFSYVHYLEALGIAVPDPEEAATRQEFFTLLAAVVPEDMLSPINTIEALPDTDDADVLRFYSAGILTGVDRFGTFAGDKTLTRAECAAMIARVARTELRVSFVPQVPEAGQTYTIYVGQAGSFRTYACSTLWEPAPAADSVGLVRHLLSELSALTGWNLDTVEVYTGKGGVTISWADTSALFVGPPDPQKEDFHVYDGTQLAFSVLDSVQQTVRMAFSPANPEALDVWFCGPDGGPLTLDNLGVTLPLEQPYSHDLLADLFGIPKG